MYESMQDEESIGSQARAWQDRNKRDCCDGAVCRPKLSVPEIQDIEEAIEGIGLKTVNDLLAERAKDYGPPEINMTGIGLIWTAQLRNHYGMADLPVLSGQMVALMMAGLKLNRLAKSPDHVDSFRDLAGYAQIAEDMK